MSKFKIKGQTFTNLGQTIRFNNQLREIGDQLKGPIFGVPMGVKTLVHKIRWFKLIEIVLKGLEMRKLDLIIEKDLGKR